MLKLFIIAAILAGANAYYNHGPAHQPYYGNYGHVAGPAPVAAASVIPVNPHHGNLYNHGYGNFGGLSSHEKIIEATYPGAVHKTAGYSVTNPTGYIGSDYAHGPINHPGPAATYLHPPSAIPAHGGLPYNHPGPVAIAPSVAYNSHHASIGNYAHSRYAVTEGPTYAHSRYAISGSPALSHEHRYPVGISNGIQKIGYNPVVSHMGYQSHAAQSYAW